MAGRANARMVTGRYAWIREMTSYKQALSEKAVWLFGVPIAAGLLYWLLLVLRSSKNSTAATIAKMLLDWFEA